MCTKLHIHMTLVQTLRGHFCMSFHLHYAKNRTTHREHTVHFCFVLFSQGGRGGISTALSTFSTHLRNSPPDMQPLRNHLPPSESMLPAWSQSHLWGPRLPSPVSYRHWWLVQRAAVSELHQWDSGPRPLVQQEERKVFFFFWICRTSWTGA